MATAEIARGDRIAFTRSSRLLAISLPSLLPYGAATTLYKASPRVGGANRARAASQSSQKKDLEIRQSASFTGTWLWDLRNGPERRLGNTLPHSLTLLSCDSLTPQGFIEHLLCARALY